MKTKQKVNIFLVDDDILYLRLLEIELGQDALFEINSYNTGEQCINALAKSPNIIILDYHLNGINKKAMNGIETLAKIKLFNKEISVIMLSAQDKIDVAVSCMHHGAFDYIIKSETAFLRLHKSIKSILELKKMKLALNWYMDKV